MPRFLWLGLLACVACVIAVLVFVRGDEQSDAAELVHEQVPHTSVGDDAVLAGSDFASSAPRAAVDVDTESASLEPRREQGESELAKDGAQFEQTLPFEGGMFGIRVVRDEDGERIPGAEVQLASANSWHWREPDNRTAITDARGAVMFTSVREGLARITAFAKGRPAVTETLEIWREEPRATVEIRLPLGREVRVHLLDALGRPFRAEDWGLAREDIGLLGLVVSGACGRLGESFQQGGAPKHTARAGGSGPFTWTVELLGAGDACVQAVLGETVVGVVPLLPDVTEVAVRIDPAAIDAAKGSVVVRVTDADGVVPIVGAKIEFHRGSWQDVVVQTGSDGRALCRLALPAGATAVVRAPSYAPILVAFERPLPPEVLVRLAPARAIGGRVVDDAGRPIPSAKVFLRGGNGSDPRLLPSKVSHVLCAADGSFRFQDLPAFEFEITTSAKSSKGKATMQKDAHADCRQGDVNDLVIVVPIGIP